MEPKILVSLCLLGAPVRFDRRAKTLDSHYLRLWLRKGLVVPLCPEVAAGLPTPREPVEIEAGYTAEDVIGGQGRVLSRSGRDQTADYLHGAQIALDLANARNCSFALLTDFSPSCGSTQIHAGFHDGRKKVGQGLVSALLRQNGVRVYAPDQAADLDAALQW